MAKAIVLNALIVLTFTYQGEVCLHTLPHAGAASWKPLPVILKAISCSARAFDVAA